MLLANISLIQLVLSGLGLIRQPLFRAQVKRLLTSQTHQGIIPNEIMET